MTHPHMYIYIYTIEYHLSIYETMSSHIREYLVTVIRSHNIIIAYRIAPPRAFPFVQVLQTYLKGDKYKKVPVTGTWERMTGVGCSHGDQDGSNSVSHR